MSGAVPIGTPEQLQNAVMQSPDPDDLWTWVQMSKPDLKLIWCSAAM